ncbi:unnamed protein product [Cunninghamella echinulata]
MNIPISTTVTTTTTNSVNVNNNNNENNDKKELEKIPNTTNNNKLNDDVNDKKDTVDNITRQQQQQQVESSLSPIIINNNNNSQNNSINNDEQHTINEEGDDEEISVEDDDTFIPPTTFTENLENEKSDSTDDNDNSDFSLEDKMDIDDKLKSINENQSVYNSNNNNDNDNNNDINNNSSTTTTTTTTSTVDESTTNRDLTLNSAGLDNNNNHNEEEDKNNNNKDEKDDDDKKSSSDRVVELLNNTIIPSTTLTNDENEMIFDRHIISEEEKINNPEWFRNKQSKPPDRYLKIRNHMLDCWKQCRPKYLTKTSARKGLKDCGDVNAIGRVHTYLESIGAINVDCVNSAPRPPIRKATTPSSSSTTNKYDDHDYNTFSMHTAADLIIDYEGPRKRKVRDEHGEWVDPKDLEGRVIEHGVPKQIVVSRPKRNNKKSQHYYGGDDFSRGYDPFRLVPVAYYNDEEKMAPFTVEMTSTSLLIMDFHSHLAHTEIIGLLGGKFISDPDGDDSSGNSKKKRLIVESVFPCKSTSTGIQCEMDPNSEMEAREFFSNNDYIVVGWYHSHPTFEPHPSIRDIENQTSYQTLFRHEETGDEPFIGVIVTPYDIRIASEHSKVQYLHISKDWNEDRSFRVPYACDYVVKQDENIPSFVMEQIKALVDEFKDYEHKMDMLSDYGLQSRLNKLLNSLRSNLFTDAQQINTFLDSVRSLMMDTFIDQKESETQQQNEQHLSFSSSSSISNEIKSLENEQ